MPPHPSQNHSSLASSGYFTTLPKLTGPCLVGGCVPTAAAILGFGHPPSSYLLLTNSQSNHPPPSSHSGPSLMLHIPSRVLLSVSPNHLANVLQDKERMEERMGTSGKRRRRRRLWETGSPLLASAATLGRGIPTSHWSQAPPTHPPIHWCPPQGPRPPPPTLGPSLLPGQPTHLHSACTAQICTSHFLCSCHYWKTRLNNP